MKNLIPRVIQWAEESNLVNPADIQPESLMMIYKFGKLTEVILQGKNSCSEIGDCLINLIIICRMGNISLAECIDYPVNDKDERLKDPQYMIGLILSSLGEVCKNIGMGKDFKKDVCYLFIYLTIIATLHNSSLLECLEVSFKKLQNKKIIRFNGILLEETHEDYPAALVMMKGNKRMKKIPKKT